MFGTNFDSPRKESSSKQPDDSRLKTLVAEGVQEALRKEKADGQHKEKLRATTSVVVSFSLNVLFKILFAYHSRVVS